MSVFETIRTVLAVRSYSNRQIPEDALRRIVESAHLSASARNKQPWHFVVVDDPATIAQIAGLAKSGPYIAGAPVVIAAAAERASRFAEADVSRAIQSMVLTAWEDGIGSNWVGFGGLNDIAELLGIPESFDLLAVLPFGYPSDTRTKGVKERKPVGEVVSHGRFGEPFR